jgi:hypothetical protein
MRSVTTERGIMVTTGAISPRVQALNLPVRICSVFERYGLRHLGIDDVGRQLLRGCDGHTVGFA